MLKLPELRTASELRAAFALRTACAPQLETRPVLHRFVRRAPRRASGVDSGLVITSAPFATSEIVTTEQLADAGWAARELTRAVRARELIRVRRGHYALPRTDARVLEAVRIGGVLGCVSALERLGVWVAEHPFVHVSLHHSASRLRSPRDRHRPLSAENRDGSVLHWWPTLGPNDGAMLSVIDALAQIVRCQPRPLAVSSLDSALHEKIIDESALDRVFEAVPLHFGALRRDIDSRSMSGLETIVRLMVKDAGLRCEPQVTFAGLGDVDLVVEGCIVIETDGHQNHDKLEHRRRDYARDAALAARGYIVLRFNYRQVVHQPEVVMAAIRGALRTHRSSSRG